MGVIRCVPRLMRHGLGAFAADRRGGAGLEFAFMLVVSVVTAMQVAALVGASLQQTFAPVTAALASLNGG